MTKTSIIIPTFREAKHIGGTLNNVTKIPGDVEIIIVETVSDETPLLEKALEKHKGVQLYKIEHRGIAKAKNYGAEKASGDILIFLDADVLVTKDLVQKVTAVLQDAAIVGATCNNYPIEPKISELFFFKLYNPLIRLVLNLPSRKIKHSRGEFIAVKRVHFEEIGGFNEHLACLEDGDLARRISKLGRFVFIKDLTVYESMRRFRGQGQFNTIMLWFKNWLFFFVNSGVVSKEWKPVR